jgi:uncharacterized protein
MNDNATENTSSRLRLVGRVALFMCSCAVVLAVAAPIGPRLSARWPELATGAVASLGTLLLTVLFVRWESLRLEQVGAAFHRWSLVRLVFGFLVGLLLVTLWSSISAAVGYVRWVRAPEFDFAATTIALLSFGALACREELAFRGYPLRRLERPFGLWGAQFLVVLVFVAEHWLGGWPWGQTLLGVAVGSLLFGMAAIATRGLAVPIGLHAAWNFGQWTLGLRGAPGLWEGVVAPGREAPAELVGMIIYFAVMGSATLAFWLWHRRMNRAFHGQRRCPPR